MDLMARKTDFNQSAPVSQPAGSPVPVSDLAHSEHDAATFERAAQGLSPGRRPQLAAVVGWIAAISNSQSEDATCAAIDRIEKMLLAPPSEGLCQSTAWRRKRARRR